MSRVYAVDAVHEFPFTRPGVPSRLEGRDEIVNWIAEGWKANPLKYERYRTLAIYDTGDPETIVVEQEVIGTSASTGEFALPNIVVLTVRNGQIAHLRDYVNILAAASAMGRDISTVQPNSPGAREVARSGRRAPPPGRGGRRAGRGRRVRHRHRRRVAVRAHRLRRHHPPAGGAHSRRDPDPAAA